MVTLIRFQETCCLLVGGTLSLGQGQGIIRTQYFRNFSLFALFLDISCLVSENLHVFEVW